MEATATRVLVVDDEPLVQKSCIRALRAEGMTVESASTGGEGLSRLQGGQFNVVLLDIKLPDCDGIDLLRSIKENGTEAAVVIITGYPTARTAVEALSCGACEYVVKPFSPAELKAAVTKALGGSERQRTAVLHRAPSEASRPAPGLGVCRSVRTTTRNSEQVAIVGLNESLDARVGLWEHVIQALRERYVPITVEYGRHEVNGTEILDYLKNNGRVVVVASAPIGKMPGQFATFKEATCCVGEQQVPLELPQIGLPHLFPWLSAIGLQSDLIVVAVQPDEEGRFVVLNESAGLTGEIMKQALQEESWYRHRYAWDPMKHKW